jgi:hypothetical protein
MERLVNHREGEVPRCVQGAVDEKRGLERCPLATVRLHGVAFMPHSQADVRGYNLVSNSSTSPVEHGAL